MTATKKYRVAVIGVGNMGKNHLRIYSEIPSVNVIAISDLNSSLIETFATKYHANAYLDFRKMLDGEDVDIVSICVPTSKHYEIARECVGRGINVLLEKPIANDIYHAQDLLDFAEKRSVKFLVGHIERFNPMVNRIKKIVGQGQIGKIIAIIARRVGMFPPQIQDVDVAIDLAIHDIDICNYLLGNLPFEIRKNGQRNLTKNREDSVEFFLRYESGASSYIQANWVTPVKIRKLIITGETGYLEADYISQEIELYENRGAGEVYVIKIVPDKKEPLREELLYFIDCVEKDVIIDSRFALDSLRIALNL
ncbi:MAG: Gfo/Idh/MocA family oxidoreductase [Patescibacteria group bacterium]|mgnify:FL=1